MSKKTGRPSKIAQIDIKQVKVLATEGYTDRQLAGIFDVTEQTINNWKKDYPVFFESLKSGKLLADKKVEVSLFQRACGYSHPEIHISNHQGHITKTPIIKHYPPDATSMIFWLKNRNAQEWRDTQHLTGEGFGKTEIVIIRESIKPKQEGKEISGESNQDRIQANQEARPSI